MPRNKKTDKRELQNQIEEEQDPFNINYRKEAIKQLGDKYVEWFDKNMKNVKEFWWGNFIFPIVFPLVSLSITHYVLHYNFTREQGIIMFMLFYLTTIVGRLLSKYQKLVSILDVRFDELYGRNEKKKTY